MRIDNLGKQLVDAVFEAVRLTHLPEKTRIVVLQNLRTDPYSAHRLESITKPLDAAGHRLKSSHLKAIVPPSPSRIKLFQSEPQGRNRAG